MIIELIRLQQILKEQKEVISIVVLAVAFASLLNSCNFGDKPEPVVAIEEPVVAEAMLGPVPSTEIAYEAECRAQETLVSIGHFTVTAYCPCVDCCGKMPDDPLYGITATGTTATQGRTIAVDPYVIPHGSKVLLEGPDGLEEYVAEDSGTRGYHIDLFFDSHEEALQWGVRTLEVFTYE